MQVAFQVPVLLKENFHSPSNLPGCPEFISKCFWICIGLLATYKLFDDGLTDFLNLEILLHGTGPKNFLKINFQRADPTCGGSESGSIAALQESPIKNNYQKTSRGLFLFI